MVEKLNVTLSKALGTIVNNLADKKITNEEVLKELNEAVHYNASSQPFIFELFFMKALEMGKVPKSSILVGMLFKNFSLENCVVPESYDSDGTRMKVLKALDLKNSVVEYENYLIKEDPESHIKFKLGTKDSRYLLAKKSNATIETLKKVISQELN